GWGGRIVAPRPAGSRYASVTAARPGPAPASVPRTIAGTLLRCYLPALHTDPGGSRVMDAEITQLLVRARNGEPERLGEVFQALYPELMRMARSRLRGRNATMTPTVLVHELFLRVTA